MTDDVEFSVFEGPSRDDLQAALFEVADTARCTIQLRVVRHFNEEHAAETVEMVLLGVWRTMNLHAGHLHDFAYQGLIEPPVVVGDVVLSGEVHGIVSTKSGRGWLRPVEEPAPVHPNYECTACSGSGRCACDGTSVCVGCAGTGIDLKSLSE